MPGIIQSISDDGTFCVVQPAIQAAILDPLKGTRVDTNISQLLDVPIVFPRGGQYTMTFPVKAGDEALVIISSRCIDNWWAHGGVQPQRELRMHDLSDGFALVGPFSQATKISNISTTTVQLRSNDGTLFWELDAPNKIARLITPDASVTVDGNNKNVVADVDGTTFSINQGSIVATATNITLNGSLTVNGASQFTGDMHVTGNINATGTISP